MRKEITSPNTDAPSSAIFVPVPSGHSRAIT
jgi:hypothetical protein